MSRPDHETQTRIAQARLGESRITEARYLAEATKTIGRLASEGPVAVDPELAEQMGAFEEDALSLEAALDSHFDSETADETDDPVNDPIDDPVDDSMDDPHE